MRDLKDAKKIKFTGLGNLLNERYLKAEKESRMTPDF